MNNDLSRRQLMAHTLCATSITAGSLLPNRSFADGTVLRNNGTSLKLSLNAYSLNGPLRRGDMTLSDVIDYCASRTISGLDATGYYFPGYPDVPDDSFVFNLKRKAFLNGISIHGTGVKNDFSVTDAERRRSDIQRVKNWIEVAEKLGASVVRIFSGLNVPDGYTFDQVLEWMIPAIKECVEHGRQHGVMVGLQNHNDFAKTAAETIQIVEAVHSEWIGVILDTGSLRQHDPYDEIARLLPYAISWQLKENVWYGKETAPVDMTKIKALIDVVGYRGFLPIEILGSADPKEKIDHFISKVRSDLETT